MVPKGQTWELFLQGSLIFLLLSSYLTVLSESVTGYLGCLPPGGHGGEGMGAHKNQIAALCWSVSNTSTCLWLCPDTSCGFPKKIHVSVGFSLSSCQPIGICQRPVSSSGGKRQHPGLGCSSQPLPCGVSIWPA